MTSARPVVFLHIGAMKTGTTYLQTLLQGNRKKLREHGFLLPGKQGDFTRGARDVLGITGNDEALRARVDGVWQALTDEMRAWDGSASLYSMEFLSFANKRKAKRILRSLHGVDVHVVLTVRDSLGALPAQWQTYSRNRGTVSWPDFAVEVREGTDGPALKTFHRAQDVIRMLDVWTPLVSEDRFHVVTVPPSSAPRDLLWERFAGLVGVDPATVRTDKVRGNPSLGYASSDLLRRANPAMAGVRLSAYQKVVRYAGREVLAARREAEPKHRLDEATAAFAAAWNADVRERLVHGGVHVVGDLEDLPTVADPARLDAGDRPEDVDPDLVADAALGARVGLRAWADTRDLALPAGDSAAWSEAEAAGEPIVSEGLTEDGVRPVREVATLLRMLATAD
ncbi:MAG: hypothetical protein Q8Q02_17015 [Nocardioides sp.]|nr:hypothetical protein [Nocardioides sp.]